MGAAIVAVLSALLGLGAFNVSVWILTHENADHDPLTSAVLTLVAIGGAIVVIMAGINLTIA